MSESVGAWDAFVRGVDFDRYLSSLFAPAALRGHLNVLYAFNHEVAKTAETVSQPIAGQIRLQWWRDRISELYRGAAIDHPLSKTLGEVIDTHRLPRGLFEALIEAREHDLEEAPFPTLTSFEAYADATSGHLMRLAARILGARDSVDAPARELGIAYAMTGLCRSLPYHASRRRLMLPVDQLSAAGLSVEDVFAGTTARRMQPLMQAMAAHARANLRKATGLPLVRRYLPALLPAAVLRLYLKVLTKPGFDIYRDSTEIAVHRRLLAMLSTMVKGRF